MRHPIHRDSAPAEHHPFNAPNAKVFVVWALRFILAFVINYVLAEGLRWIGNVPGPRPATAFWCYNTLFNPGFLGQLLQACVLEAPSTFHCLACKQHVDTWNDIVVLLCGVMGR